MSDGWIQDEMPMLVAINVAGSDDWLRQIIRASDLPVPPRLQYVIVQGTREAERIMTRIANLKAERGLPYGGCMRQRYVGSLL